MSKAAKPSYTVLRAFSHMGKWYTRDNQDEVADLPASVIRAHIDGGSIAESGGEGTTPETAPPPKEPTGKDK